ncbi:UDP-N-acetylmuramoyl-tripeptide--D-alanyl-D-alanine ligase [Tersicoccus solisilvae]|uniref:UDP-N-acetylmuramoyl-tripeptide--D-alanyl-D-alanine ligase n=1 Tax=Tersicoccus solisilvae TaxID=1882339 RepID=A0ABQ1PCJ9_9MICC|nr:UDP-N-acetylmuramoyl-tripeptide--D-alanyl-D-alanine ligase [Tersicoccus solisilvae]GGC94580.1 UDP-N-acetylmuramoyl-tripeptide--D-alanyl-D-alanine ligase [Tersicoccus solisilvae]
MMDLTASQIAAITGGTLSPGTDPATVITSVATDSREVTDGTLFVAKPGEVADGHDFIPAARTAGATLVLAERETTDDAGRPHPAVVVPDAVVAMGALAADHVARLRAAGPLTVVGITGSAGKTTTKDLTMALLATLGPTVGPIGSYNGEVGVPLTVFTAGPGTRYLVIEMGATQRGNIAYLADLVRPDLGAVLMVGTAHLGEFGSVENIVATKGELVEALPAAGTAVLNHDDERVRSMAQRTGAAILWFTADPHAGELPEAASAVRATDLHTDADGHPVFTLHLPAGPAGAASEHEVRSRLIGIHHIGNLLASAALAHAAGVPGADIAAVLTSSGAVSRWRMERTDRADGVTVINDAYNANPDSMRAALRTLAALGADSGRRTWAVLGAMLELGEDSIAEHDAVGRAAVRLNIAQLVVVGEGARAMHTGAVMEGSWGDESQWVPDVAAAEAVLADRLRPGDIVLVKSSNGAGLRHLGDRIAWGPMSSQDTDEGPAAPEVPAP